MDVDNLSSADATAIIDGALLDAQNSDAGAPTTPEMGPGPNPIIPTAEPIAPAPPELTKEELAALKEQQKVDKAQEDLLGKEQAEALRKEQADKERKEATLLGALEKYLASGKQAAQGAGLKIANIPTPGDIIVPLSLLIIFFFLLVTFSGNTRAQWFWLVLTGNAYVSGSLQSGSSGTGTTGHSGKDASTLLVDIAPVYTYKGGGMGSPF